MTRTDAHWQVVEITGVGLGEMWFDVVQDDLTQQDAQRRAERRDRHVAVPMSYNPEGVPIGGRVDDYNRTVVEQ